eukprot:UN13636
MFVMRSHSYYKRVDHLQQLHRLMDFEEHDLVQAQRQVITELRTIVDDKDPLYSAHPTYYHDDAPSREITPMPVPRNAQLQTSPERVKRGPE